MRPATVEATAPAPAPVEDKYSEESAINTKEDEYEYDEENMDDGSMKPSKSMRMNGGKRMRAAECFRQGRRSSAPRCCTDCESFYFHEKKLMLREIQRSLFLCI